jgi:hypothetical protein
MSKHNTTLARYRHLLINDDWRHKTEPRHEASKSVMVKTVKLLAFLVTSLTYFVAQHVFVFICRHSTVDTVFFALVIVDAMVTRCDCLSA